MMWYVCSVDEECVIVGVDDGGVDCSLLVGSWCEVIGRGWGLVVGSVA